MSPSRKSDKRSIAEESEKADSVASLEDIKAGSKTDFKFGDIGRKLTKTSSIEHRVMDIPLYCDKTLNLKSMETVFGSIMMGCAMG